MLKWTYGLSGNDYRVAEHTKLYLTVKGFNMQILDLIGQFFF